MRTTKVDDKKTLLTCALAIFGFCVNAYADGFFVWNKGVDLYGPSQKAIILFDEGVEDLILQVKYKGQASDFAWIVPVPSEPQVKAVDGEIFAEISEYTQRRAHWDVFSHFRGKGVEEQVEVISRKKVSVYDVAVLNAKHTQALITWLNENGFFVPDRAQAILRDYIKKKWTFAALRIHPDEESLWVEKSLNEGTLVPLKFTFSSKEIVYPLKVSSLNKGQTEVLIYAFYKDAVVHPDFWAHGPRAGEFYAYSQGPYSSSDSAGLKLWRRDRKAFPKYFDFQRKFFRRVTKSELALCRKALPRLNKKNFVLFDRKFYLSKLRHTFRSEDMQFDVVLKPVEKLSKRDRYLFVKRQAELWHEDPKKVKILDFGNALLLRAKEEAIEYIADELKKQTTRKTRWYGAFEFLSHHPSAKALKVMEDAASNRHEPIREDLVEALYWTAERYGLDKKLIAILRKLAETGHEARVEEILDIMNSS